jgi:hypothetical protein
MAEEVGALRVSVRANAAEIEADMGRIRSIVNSASAQMQRGMLAFRNSANKAVGEIFNLRNAAIGIAGGAFISLIKRSVQFGDSIGETADMIGIGARALQELRYAAGIAGVSTEEFDRTLLQLSKRLGEAQLGVNETSRALGQLGISMESIRRMKTDQVFNLIADRIGGIADPMQRAQISTDLFGKSAQKLLPTLVQGSAYLAKMADEAHRMGLVLSDETLKQASDANDEFDRLGTALKVAGVNIAVGALPAMKDLRATFTSAEFQNGVRNIAESLGKLITWMVSHKEDVLKITAAFAGMRIGATFGVPGAVIGGVLGLLTASVAASDKIKILNTDLVYLRNQISRIEAVPVEDRTAAQRKNLEKYRDDLEDTEAKFRSLILAESNAPPAPATLTVTPAPNPISPDVQKAIEDLSFKTRILNDDFKALAPGFPEMAQGLNLFGTAGHAAVTSVSELSPELQLLNDELLRNQAAKVIDGLKSSTEQYNLKVAETNLLHDTGNLSAEKYAQRLQQIRFPSLTTAIDDVTNLHKQLDSFSTRSLDSAADALTDIATGSANTKQAFSKLAQSIVRDLIAMTIKAALFRLIGGFLFGFSGGGSVMAGVLGADVGGVGRKASGGAIAGEGTGTSDSILSWLSNGEYVVNAEDARNNHGLLEAINAGAIPRFAQGGDLSRYRSADIAEPLGGGSGPPAVITLNVKARSGFDREWLRGIVDGINDMVADGYRLRLS